MKTNPVLAWHFTGPALRDGRPIPAIGEPLVHSGGIIPCKAGLHASIDPFDALRFAPGPMLHRVECSGQIIKHGGDKIVCRQRTIVASIDATALLRRFACDQAIEALRIAAITPPQIVTDYLRTADESIRDAAWAATWAAARDAAWDAARDAARAAVWAAARGDAWDAARAAAWAAAWAAAGDAAGAAAGAAAKAAAGAAAGAAAWDAARAAAMDVQAARLREVCAHIDALQLEAS